MDEILVSVICLAYNHGEYIADALEGFTNQKTSFNFEVLIHDDASPDNTADIIRCYWERYPEIIKPIFQKENQHSKGVPIGAKYLFPHAKGKYIALCEGDDYWIDMYKLQKQVDFLENHPQYIGITHNTRYINAPGNDINIKAVLYGEEADSVFTLEKFVSGKGVAGHTSSYMYRNIYTKELIKKILNGNFPRLNHTGLTCYLALLGDIFYSKEVMSCHRYIMRKDATNWKSNMTYKQNIYYELYDLFCQLERMAKEEFDKSIDLWIHKKYIWYSSIKRSIKKPSKENIKILWKIWKTDNRKLKLLFGALFKMPTYVKKVFFNKIITKVLVWKKTH